MTIQLYQNKSDAIVLNKTIGYYATINGYLRDSCSLLNPVIMFEYTAGDTIFVDVATEDNEDLEDDLGVLNPYNILEANYCFIEEFKRYYYITNITCINNKIYAISMSVDVLMSYKDNILSQKAFVTRNEFTYDAYVKDDEVSYYYDKEVYEGMLPTGNKVNTTFKTDLGYLHRNITISVINDEVGYFNTDKADSPVAYLPNVYNGTEGNTFTSRTYVLDQVSITRLSKRVLNDDDLASFILSIIIYPFTFDTKTYSEYLRLGTTDLDETEEGANDEVDCWQLDTNVSKYLVIADFTFEGDTHSFLDYEPYTEYELYIPYLSWIKISADLLLGNRIIVYYVINYQSGNAQVNVFDITHNRIIYTSNCQLGIKLAINTTNQKEVNDNRNSNNIGLGVGLLTSALSIATGNPLAVAGGLISVGKTISSYIQNMNTNYLKANGSVSSGQSGLYLPQYVKLRRTYLKPKEYNANYFKYNGRPLNKVVELSSLKGYTRCGDLHLENYPSTLEESQLIKQLLLDGIIL